MSQGDSNSHAGCVFLLLGGLAIAAAAWWARLPPFQPRVSRPRMAQSEVRTYIGALNRAQQAYYLEQEQLTTNIETLNLGIDTETQFFSYRATLLSNWAIQHSAVPKEIPVYIHTGLVWLVINQGEPDAPESESDGVDAVIPNALRCVSQQRTIAAPPKFQLPELPLPPDSKITCPEGYEEL